MMNTYVNLTNFMISSVQTDIVKEFHFFYGRFGHLSTKFNNISKHYNSLKSYVFSNLKTESYRAC